MIPSLLAIFATIQLLSFAFLRRPKRGIQQRAKIKSPNRAVQNPISLQLFQAGRSFHMGLAKGMGDTAFATGNDYITARATN
jgi:hypothetical protein